MKLRIVSKLQHRWVRHNFLIPKGESIFEEKDIPEGAVARMRELEKAELLTVEPIHERLTSEDDGAGSGEPPKQQDAPQSGDPDPAPPNDAEQENAPEGEQASNDAEGSGEPPKQASSRKRR